MTKATRRFPRSEGNFRRVENRLQTASESGVLPLLPFHRAILYAGRRCAAIFQSDDREGEMRMQVNDPSVYQRHRCRSRLSTLVRYRRVHLKRTADKKSIPRSSPFHEHPARHPIEREAFRELIRATYRRDRQCRSVLPFTNLIVYATFEMFSASEANGSTNVYGNEIARGDTYCSYPRRIGKSCARCKMPLFFFISPTDIVASSRDRRDGREGRARRSLSSFLWIFLFPLAQNSLFVCVRG